MNKIKGRAAEFSNIYSICNGFSNCSPIGIIKNHRNLTRMHYFLYMDILSLMVPR